MKEKIRNWDLHSDTEKETWTVLTSIEENGLYIYEQVRSHIIFLIQIKKIELGKKFYFEKEIQAM